MTVDIPDERNLTSAEIAEAQQVVRELDRTECDGCKKAAMDMLRELGFASVERARWELFR